jgi:lysyl-tRNA synthetase class 1
MVVPFAMLLNLAAVSGAEERETLWKYLRRYAPEASPETHPGLDAAAGYAVRYFQKHVKPTRVHRLPTERERAAIEDLARGCGPLTGRRTRRRCQTIVYAVGNEHGFQPLRDWFKALYEVLIGASEGPRFGGFVALYGVPETVRLIETALAGGLAAESEAA